MQKRTIKDRVLNNKVVNRYAESIEKHPVAWNAASGAIFVGGLVALHSMRMQHIIYKQDAQLNMLRHTLYLVDQADETMYSAATRQAMGNIEDVLKGVTKKDPVKMYNLALGPNLPNIKRVSA